MPKPSSRTTFSPEKKDRAAKQAELSEQIKKWFK